MTKNTLIKTISLFVILVITANNSFAQVYAKNGMVACDNTVASQVGVNILKKGGNAIDASIATAFALAVIHPQAGNIGGGGFLVFMNSEGKATTIDFREKAPLLATSDMFLDDKGTLIKGSNHKGLKSVGVPGTVAGLYMAHQKYGVLPWKDLVQPAVDLAQNGVVLSWTLAQHTKKHNAGDYPQFLKDYYRNDKGELTEFGEIWVQQELATTLELLT